ncbi:MAG: hypothetical protein JNL74_11905 [Fibrobacteres bacterium]|nr:hypothetical protein [Fibrobacterota bacterium]
MKFISVYISLFLILLVIIACESKAVKRPSLTGNLLLASDAGLLLKNITTGKIDTLSPNPQGCFSPDGKYIAYFNEQEMAICIVSAKERKEVKKITVNGYNTTFSMSAANGQSVIYWEDTEPGKSPVILRTLIETTSEPQVVHTNSLNDSPMVVAVPGSICGNGKQGLVIGFDNNNGSPIKSIDEIDFSSSVRRNINFGADAGTYSNLEVSKDDKMCLAIIGRTSGKSEVLQWPWSKPANATAVTLPPAVSRADSLVDSTAYKAENWQIAAASFSSGSSDYICLTNAYYKSLGANSKIIVATRGYILNRETSEAVEVSNFGVLDYFPGELK